MVEKKCTKCSRILSLDNFCINRQYKVNGTRPDCKECNIKKYKEYRTKNKEEVQGKDRERYKKGLKKADNLGIVVKKRGITKEMFFDLLDHQKDRCLICLMLFDYSSRNLIPHIDHDHSTGQIRGLLCKKCNSTLGYVKDSIPILKNCIKYLENSN